MPFTKQGPSLPEHVVFPEEMTNSRQDIVFTDWSLKCILMLLYCSSEADGLTTFHPQTSPAEVASVFKVMKFAWLETKICLPVRNALATLYELLTHLSLILMLDGVCGWPERHLQGRLLHSFLASLTPPFIIGNHLPSDSAYNSSGRWSTIPKLIRTIRFWFPDTTESLSIRNHGDLDLMRKTLSLARRKHLPKSINLKSVPQHPMLQSP